MKCIESQLANGLGQKHTESSLVVSHDAPLSSPGICIYVTNVTTIYYQVCGMFTGHGIMV